MSEYQYYEFRALDGPLTQAQMRELRSYSGRAQITPTSFVNVYNWGNFKGDRRQWMEKYFDAFLYVANWGTHRLEFRIPKSLLDFDAVSTYCTSESRTAASSLSCCVKDDHRIVSFHSEEEGGEWVDGEGWLSALTPLRASLISGDYRSLYLGWLVAAGNGQLHDDDLEPPVPPGLGVLSEPLRSLADFLRIDPDLLHAAAEASAPEQAAALSHKDIMAWLCSMDPNQKDAMMVALIESNDPHGIAELRQRVVQEMGRARHSDNDMPDKERRSVGQLLTRAKSTAEERLTMESEIRAREKAQREREQAELHRKYLEALVGKEASLWTKVDKLIAAKNASRYDDAVSLLQDLRDVAAMANQTAVFTERMETICREHARKPALLERFRKTGLTG